MMLQSQPVVVLQEVLSVRFRIIQMKMDRIKKRRVLRISMMVMIKTFPRRFLGQALLLVLFQESR